MAVQKIQGKKIIKHDTHSPNFKPPPIPEIEANGNFHELNAEKRNYLSSNQIMTEAAIKPSILQDYYVTLGDQLGDKTWSFKIQIKPFIRWIWFGAMLIALGTFVSSYKNFKRDYE